VGFLHGSYSINSIGLIILDSVLVCLDNFNPHSEVSAFWFIGAVMTQLNNNNLRNTYSTVYKQITVGSAVVIYLQSTTGQGNFFAKRRASSKHLKITAYIWYSLSNPNRCTTV